MKLDPKYRHTTCIAPPPDGYVYIWPEEQIIAAPDSDWVRIGGDGAGNEFRIRLSDATSDVYVYYPIDDRVTVIASNIADLAEGWLSSRIST